MTLIKAPEGKLAHGLSDRSISSLRDRIEVIHRQIRTEPAPVGKVPLHLACSASDCGNGLHCLDFLSKGRSRAASVRSSAEPGHCRACGAAIARLPHRSTATVDDVVTLFDQQRKELIREHYWVAPMDRWAYNQAHRLGRLGLHARTGELVRTRIGSAEHPRERRQTTWHKDVVAYGQHATATCCRRCVEYWHGIERGRPLTDAEVRRLTALVTIFLDLRLPDLPDGPSKVAPILQGDLPGPGDPTWLRNAIGSSLENGVSPAGLLVPVQIFEQLKTDPALSEVGGSVRLRPVSQQLSIDGLSVRAGL